MPLLNGNDSRTSADKKRVGMAEEYERHNYDKEMRE
jgi:hypothetical protein